MARKKILVARCRSSNIWTNCEARLIRSLAFVFLAATVCWFLSDRIYKFLAVPVEHALAEAQRRQMPIDRLDW